MYKSKSGLVYIALPYPHCIFASLPWKGNVIQSFILVSGLELFIRGEGKLKTKINPLETLSLQLLCSVSSPDDPQTPYISFSGLGFPWSAPISQQGGRSFTVPMPAMFLVLKNGTLGFRGLILPAAFSLLSAFLLEHCNAHSWLANGSSQGPGLGLHLFGIYSIWKIVGLLKNT